jgi:hypothetical protein
MLDDGLRRTIRTLNVVQNKEQEHVHSAQLSCAGPGIIPATMPRIAFFNVSIVVVCGAVKCFVWAHACVSGSTKKVADHGGSAASP